MRITLGKAKAIDPQGKPYWGQVGLDLSKPPYADEGLAVTFLGYKGAGKSNLAAVFAEQFHQARVPFIYFDRGSNCFGLRELGASVITVGDTENIIPERRAQRNIDIMRSNDTCYKMVRAVLEQGYSLAIDCAPRADHDPQGDLDREGFHNHPLACFSNFVRALYHVGQQLRRSCVLIVDEGQFFAPQTREMPIQKLSTEALALMAHDSRKAGIATVVLSQRSSYINKRVIFDSNVQIFGRHSFQADYKIIKGYCPEIGYRDLKALGAGQAYMVGPNRTSFVQFAKRTTPSFGDTPAFAPVVEQLPDGSDFLKADAPKTTVTVNEWEKI